MAELTPAEDDIPDEDIILHPSNAKMGQSVRLPPHNSKPGDMYSATHVPLAEAEWNAPGTKKLTTNYIYELGVQLEDARTEIKDLRDKLQAKSDSYQQANIDLVMVKERLKNLRGSNLLESVFIGLAGILGGAAFTLLDESPPKVAVGWLLAIVASTMLIAVIVARLMSSE